MTSISITQAINIDFKMRLDEIDNSGNILRDLQRFLANMQESPHVRGNTILFNKGQLIVGQDGSIEFHKNRRMISKYNNEREFRRAYNYIN